jgi:hypothetical protein
VESRFLALFLELRSIGLAGPGTGANLFGGPGLGN